MNIDVRRKIMIFMDDNMIFIKNRSIRTIFHDSGHTTPFPPW